MLGVTATRARANHRAIDCNNKSGMVTNPIQLTPRPVSEIPIITSTCRDSIRQFIKIHGQSATNMELCLRRKSLVVRRLDSPCFRPSRCSSPHCIICIHSSPILIYFRKSNKIHLLRKNELFEFFLLLSFLYFFVLIQIRFLLGFEARF